MGLRTWPYEIAAILGAQKIRRPLKLVLHRLPALRVQREIAKRLHRSLMQSPSFAPVVQRLF